MMEVRSWLTGKRGVSLPFTDTCDPLGAPTDALFDEVTRYGAAQGWKYWESRATRPIAPETPRFTSSSATLWSFLPMKMRFSLALIAQCGVRFERPRKLASLSNCREIWRTWAFFIRCTAKRARNTESRRNRSVFSSAFTAT